MHHRNLHGCTLNKAISFTLAGHLLRKHNFPILFTMIFGLLTKCEVKIAGYWPSSSHLDRTSLVNEGFTTSIWLSGKLFLWGTAGSPEQAR